MSNPEQSKTGGKSGGGSRKRKKQPAGVKAEQIDGVATSETASASASSIAAPAGAALMDTAARQTTATPTDTQEGTSGLTGPAPADAPLPEQASTVRLQTIAMAYRDYTRKSFEEAQSFVDKLSRVRSLDKALEVQADFAKQACETFAADSRKIRQLYGEFISQAFNPFNLSPPRRDR